MSADTYLAALKMLARRELSEAQLRLRLTRRQHSRDDIDDAVARLKADRSLDDGRVASAIARSEIGIKKRGKSRVRQKIEATGISPVIARRAVDEVFESVDADALLAAALDRRLRGRRHLADDRERQRLYRYLTGQGFDADRVLAVLEHHRPRTGST